MNKWKVAKYANNQFPALILLPDGTTIGEFKDVKNAIECCVAVNSDVAKVRALEEIQRLASERLASKNKKNRTLLEIAYLAAAGLKAAGV